MTFDSLETPAAATELDVVIIGAGLSGIDAACRLRTECPDERFAILEARDAIGGTWDLFRYPGIRSDSDMHTLGFPFRPWRGEKAIADGADIRAYIEETARAFGIERNIRFGHRLARADWSTADARWRLEVETEGGPVIFSCRFLFLCSGYYDYAAGYTPELPEIERFAGQVVHAQHWPAGLDHAGKRIVVIGSGATAVTLVPALARSAAHVTMLQRSPTYIVSRPARDRLADRLHALLPERLAGSLIRWKNILYSILTYGLARRRPERVKRVILAKLRKALDPGLVEQHFTPRYAPWDQRICLVPDGNLFDALRAGRASVTTDRIEGFTPTGIRLASGQTLEADIVVTATGLAMRLMGGAQLRIDGRPVDPAQHLVYKGMMLSDVPNLALAFGYTNASWTLKCDLTARQVCRILKAMRRRGATICVPRHREPSGERRPLLDFTSGYVKRAAAVLPQQGARAPWRVHQNYALDLAAFRFGKVEDGVLEFGREE